MKAFLRYIYYKIKFHRQNIIFDKTTIFRRGVVVDTRLSGGGQIILGKNVQIEFGVTLQSHGGKIVIGDDSYVGANCVLYGHGGLTIGCDVMIAAGSIIIPANHNYIKKSDLIKNQGESRKGITIQNDVWVGAGCLILDGVTISTGAVIAAGSVVNRSTVSYSISRGVPAKPFTNKTRI
jgi:acetyltransferase-like isoleucine patch superfamily enzyme